MTRGEYLTKLITDRYDSVRKFSRTIDMPYSTLRNMIKNVGGSGTDKVLTVCKALDITVEELCNYKE